MERGERHTAEDEEGCEGGFRGRGCGLVGLEPGRAGGVVVH